MLSSFDEEQKEHAYSRWCLMLREHTGRILDYKQSRIADMWRENFYRVWYPEIPVHAIDFVSPGSSRTAPRGLGKPNRK